MLESWYIRRQLLNLLRYLKLLRILKLLKMYLLLRHLRSWINYIKTRIIVVIYEKLTDHLLLLFNDLLKEFLPKYAIKNQSNSFNKLIQYYSVVSYHLSKQKLIWLFFCWSSSRLGVMKSTCTFRITIFFHLFWSPVCSYFTSITKD